jgi:hypothetical protein
MTTAVITQPRTTRPSKTDVARPRWPSARFSSLLRAEPPPDAVQRAERLTPRIHLPRARRAPKVPPNHCGFPSAGPEPQSVHGQACTIDPTPAFGNDQGLRITLPAQTAHSGHLRRGGAEHEARGPRTTGDNASLAGKRAPAVGILDRSARDASQSACALSFLKVRPGMHAAIGPTSSDETLWWCSSATNARST